VAREARHHLDAAVLETHRGALLARRGARSEAAAAFDAGIGALERLGANLELGRARARRAAALGPA
jgi:hypothetical protein